MPPKPPPSWARLEFVAFLQVSDSLETYSKFNNVFETRQAHLRSVRNQHVFDDHL
jgi:hypothetical protein